MLSNSNYFRDVITSPFRDPNALKPRWLQRENGGTRVVLVDKNTLYDGVLASDFSLRSSLASGVSLKEVSIKNDLTADVRDNIVSQFNTITNSFSNSKKSE